MISVSFNATKDDLLAFTCHYYGTSPTVRRSRISAQIAIPVVLAGAGILALEKAGEIRLLGVVLLLCAGLCAVFYPSWHRRILRKSAESMINESSYQKAFGAYTLTLTEDGLSSTSPIGEGRFGWGAVECISLTPEHLFIFLAGPQGYPIPRKQVPDSTIQTIKEFAEAHIRVTRPALGN